MDASEIVQQRKRQTAYKFRISELNGAEVISDQKNNFVEINGMHVTRVNVIGNVIDKFVSEGEKKYAALTIDDASSQIRIKAFGEDIVKIQNAEIGDTIVVIGPLRFFNNEIYILPEIIKKCQPEMLMLRKLEIEKKAKSAPAPPKINRGGGRISSQIRSFQPSKEEQNVIKNAAFNKIEVKEEKIGEEKINSAREKIFQMLKENEEGVDRDKLILVINMPVEEINKAVEEMLDNAEIYEPKPGRIRLL